MPRGAEYDDGKPQSDNAIDAGEDKVHGGSKPTTEVEPSHTQKTAPLPEGMDEMNDRVLSGGAAPGHESGKGGHDPKTMGENIGRGDKKGFASTEPHPIDDLANEESAIRR